MTEQHPPLGVSAGVIPSGRVRLASEFVQVGGEPPAKTPENGEWTVQLIREDGVVRAIDLTCRCGERIRLLCEYS